MSLESWKAEFYPVPASECPAEDAIEHSLRKWRGLRPEALARHGVGTKGTRLFAAVDGFFYISATNCALCEQFFQDAEEEDEKACADCPLAISRGGVSCSKAREGESFAPWEAFGAGNNPEPMIAALEKAQADAEAACPAK
jgi:hypothetical protein